MKIQFLGTGAADWVVPEPNGEFRRFTSTLLDSTLLLDGTESILDQIPDADAIADVFFTHSHPDHFSAAALAQLAPCRAYMHESWASEVQVDGVEIIPLKVGVSVTTESGFTLTPMPSNHSTARDYETTLHYLIEKDSQHLLYATDGAWLLNQEHHIIGQRTLDAVVFDATIGDPAPGDYRIFEHNSIDMIRLMTATLLSTGRLAEKAPVYLTHMARTLHPDQQGLEDSLDGPFIAAYDGLTVEF